MLTEQLVSTASHGLSLNLSSNNPFRKFGAPSPTTVLDRSPLDVPPRPVSRNPFLDVSGVPISTSPTMTPPINGDSAKTPPPLTGAAAVLFVRHFCSSFPLASSTAHFTDCAYFAIRSWPIFNIIAFLTD